ncbi:MAG: DEAD/DEAH box helicase, partial [Gemmataceae bacterium]|nr:DEAD/DEAH box helicase [Gemmataceae bacterium]
MSQFAVGSLIKARGREWIVLPESTEEQILARPLGGTEEEIAGFLPELENIQPAQFQLPSPNQAGDYLSCRLLRDALRLGFRSSAGPFRSFGRISVEPRPYQLVPLLMALKLDPVRLLIADDVGIGKTVEAALIIRELIDRGEVTRFAVLCPPQIAEQWQRELFSKFHLDAELVLPSTIHRLERACRLNQSIYERFPYQIISTDFVKSDRRRDDFVRACPELVIVDEAHTCARLGETRGGRHQRHQLLSQLAQNAERHILLVTATPHSGNEEGFRSLLSLLKPEFAHLPQDLSGDKNRKEREKIAAHFVQRRRADIRNYLRTDTPFPERFEAEENYKLHPDYKLLFEKVLEYARESVNDPTLDKQRQRIRWWSALALLRSMASSPAAAVATLRTRAVEANSIEEIDELGYKSVMDPSDEDSTEANDLVPAGTDDQLVKQNETSQKLMQMALEAEQLFGTRDNKLKQLIPKLEALLEEGFYPIIFCRFIPTAEYVASQLREHKQFTNQVQIEAVTGTLPPKEREDRINQFDETKPRILVCTDCLSEGINLQRLFNAVIHYDLSWNPTRHEQREGRVDRYGQPSARVRALTYYGLDNRIDGVVLDVLLRKHRTIRNSLGVSIPVPADSEKVLEAVFQGLLLRGKNRGAERTLWDDIDIPDEVKIEWESATEREKLSRTLFAQQTIRVEEVTQELQASQRAIGSGVDVKEFFKLALSHCGGVLTEENTLRVNITEVPRSLKERLNL